MRLPENNAEDVSQPVVFSWDEVPLAIEYQIQVALDASYINIAHQSETTETSIELWGLPTGVPLYWRVRHREV